MPRHTQRRTRRAAQIAVAVLAFVVLGVLGSITASGTSSANAQEVFECAVSVFPTSETEYRVVISQAENLTTDGFPAWRIDVLDGNNQLVTSTGTAAGGFGTSSITLVAPAGNYSLVATSPLQQCSTSFSHGGSTNPDGAADQDSSSNSDGATTSGGSTGPLDFTLRCLADTVEIDAADSESGVDELVARVSGQASPANPNTELRNIRWLLPGGVTVPLLGFTVTGTDLAGEAFRFQAESADGRRFDQACQLSAEAQAIISSVAVDRPADAPATATAVPTTTEAAEPEPEPTAQPEQSAAPEATVPAPATSPEPAEEPSPSADLSDSTPEPPTPESPPPVAAATNTDLVGESSTPLPWKAAGPVLGVLMLAPALLLHGAVRGSGDDETLVAAAPPTPAQPAPQDIGLVLSGGGLRAAAFGLGASMSLVDNKKYRSLHQVASMSGGGFTNAYLAGFAHRHQRLPAASEEVTPLAQRIATRGLPIERATLGLGLAALVGAALVSWMAASSVESVPLSVLVAIGASLLFLGLSWLVYSWLGLRPALKRWVAAVIDLPGDLRLDAVSTPQRHVDHVFTSTTPTSDHVHLSQHSILFETSRLDGSNNADESSIGYPKNVTIAQAVRASAAFPGLPHVVLNSRDLDLGHLKRNQVALQDGGTLNNLGHIGATLNPDDDDAPRHYRDWLTSYAAVSQWVVIDASALQPRISIRHRDLPNRIIERLRLGFATDLAEMANTTEARHTAQALYEVQTQFAETSSGIYLHLSHSPVDLCLDLLVGSDGRIEALAQEVQRTSELPDQASVTAAGLSSQQYRALRMLQLLEANSSGSAMATWRTRSERNPTVSTTLASLGKETTFDLIYHGYVLTATKGVLELGWPVPELASLSEARFRTIAGIDL